MRGKISPKIMAVMIRNDVAPFVTMLVSRAAGAPGPIATHSTCRVAVVKQEKARQSFQIDQLRCAVQ
jgi:hypothetical protein